jgi:O-antigen ligase
MVKKYEITDRIIEYGIYLYIVFMFLSKGEGIRNILIFGNFGLWLSTLRYRKNLYLLKEPVSILCWIFLGISFFSVIFSIDPWYSFQALRSEPLKFALLFPVIATVMSDTVRLKRVIHVFFFAALVITSIGFYSYLAHNIEVLRPDIPLMDTGMTGHGKFARYLLTLLPFAFILYLVWDKKPILKLMLTFSFIFFILSIILSTSREGYLALFAIVIIWAMFLSRIKGYNLKKILSIILVITIIIGTVSYFSFPDVKKRMSRLPGELRTVNERTEVWVPALYAIRQKPFFGWGYGKRIFRLDEPYKETPFKKGPERDAHNIFLSILFSQGITGLLPFMFLLLFAMKYFWRAAFTLTGMKSYILMACLSILVGNYFIIGMLANLKLKHLAIVLGMGMAAQGTDENSDT